MERELDMPAIEPRGSIPGSSRPFSSTEAPGPVLRRQSGPHGSHPLPPTPVSVKEPPEAFIIINLRHLGPIP